MGYENAENSIEQILNGHFEKNIEEECRAIEKEFIFDRRYCKYIKASNTYKPEHLDVNLKKLLEHEKIQVKYNEISKEIEYVIPWRLEITQDNRTDIAIEAIFNKCVYHNFNVTKSRLEAMLLSISEENKYNPVKDFILECYENLEGYNFDSCDEIKRLSDTITVEDGFSTEFRDLLIKRWLVSCVKAVFTKKGFKSEGVLTLQGEQGLLKTTWLKNLCPNEDWWKDGYTLDPSNKDQVLQCVKYWLIELGELETTFKKDIGKIKAFISKDYDEFRKAYARGESKYPRRTVFCASVNNAEFLKDETGNRRWWVIPCKKIEIAKLNLVILWAEVYHLYMKGEKHYLDRDELKILNDTNRKFEEKNYIDTLIECSFRWNKSSRYWLTSKDVFLELGKPVNVTLTAITKSLIKLGCEMRITRGSKQFAIPKTMYSEARWDYVQLKGDNVIDF